MSESACEHCPDGHENPESRPWGVFVASERDSDGQPTHLYVAPTAGQHVAESDAEWVRAKLNDTTELERLRNFAKEIEELALSWSHYEAYPYGPGAEESAYANGYQSATESAADTLQDKIKEFLK